MDTLVDQNMMGESGGAAVGSLEVSISFGKFENDSLSWEKWSSFSQNKYLEEVEKCATPGSVAEKKAYFEAHYKRIAARKAEIEDQQRQLEINLLKSENSKDEDLADDTEEVYSEVLKSDDQKSVVGLKEEDELIGEVSNAKFDEQPQMLAAEKVKEEVNLTDELSRTNGDEMPQVDAATGVNEETSLSGEVGIANLDEKPQVDDAVEAIEMASLSNELSIASIDQKPKGNAKVASQSLSTEGENEFISASESLKEVKEEDKFVLVEEEINPNTSRSATKLPENEDNESGDAPKFVENVKMDLQKSSIKKIDENKERIIAKVKMTPLSKIQKMPQVTTPSSSSAKKGSQSSITRTKNSSVMSRPALTPTMTPVSRSSAKKGNSSLISRSKNSTAMSRPMMTPSTTSASQSSTKKTSDSTMSRNKSPTAGGSRKPAPTALHMSISFSPKPSDDTAPVAAVRKSLFMEKMGDKDIVKRAFKAFQNSVHSKPSDEGRVSVPDQVLKSKTQLRPSTSITTRKEKGGLHRTGGTDEKRMEFLKKPNEKSNVKDAEKPHLRSKSKEEKEAEIKKLRQSFNFKAVPLPSFYKVQNLSKSLREKEASRNELH